MTDWHTVLHGANIREVDTCCCDYVSKQVLRGEDLPMEQYRHAAFMRRYRVDPDRGTVVRPELTQWVDENCQGDVAFCLIFETDADADSEVLCSYRMVFSMDRDALLFKLSEWFS